MKLLRFLRANYFTILFASGLFLTPSVLNAQTSSGTIFRDYNANGTNDIGEPLISGVLVKAYNSAGDLCASTTSSGTISPNYTLPTTCTGQVRIEFEIPATNTNPGGAVAGIEYTTSGGSNYGSSVQFVTAGATNVNFGVNLPSDYCGVNPVLSTPCYTNGSRIDNSTEPAVVLFNDNDRGQGVPHTVIATVGEVGAVWGETYNPFDKKLFVSAFVKRHADISPNGLGAIYSIDVTTPTTAGAGTPTLWLDINAATFVNQSNVAVNLGLPTDPGATLRDLGLKTNASRDNWGFANMGKQGIGDIELSEDGQRMYVMDLTNRQVLCIDYNTKKLIWKLPVSTPTCAGGATDIRPWALKEHKGILYVGAICSGETTLASGGSTASARLDMHYYVMKCNSLTAATSMSLAADLGNATNKDQARNWYPWYGDVSSSFIQTLATGAFLSTAQPLISDIEFDKDGNMIVGFMDRTGHQFGYKNLIPNVTNTNLISVIALGDITRAVNSGSSYTVETAPWTFFNLTAVGPASAPNDQFLGGLVMTNSDDNYAVANIIDPFTVDANGVTWNKTSDGQMQGGTPATGRLEIVPNIGANVSVFGKGNGLGDLSVFCAPAPIEIGNRVWTDTDKDGIQDAGEVGIDGVTVLLFEGTTQVGTTTTANGGQYYFNAANVTGGIKPNTAYEVRIATAQAPLSTLSLTTTDIGTNGSDLIDNDGIVSGANAIKTLTTGSVGQNNHTYDFGFSPPCDTTLSVINTAICSGATVDLFTLVNGVKGTLTYSTNGTTWAALNSPTNVTPSVTTIYYVKDTLTYGCFDIDTLVITVNPNPTTPSLSSPQTNVCPVTTVNLTTISSALTPSVSGGVFEWHVSNNSSSALVNTPMVVGNGTYYLFEKSPSGCFSASENLIVNIVFCCPTVNCAKVTVVKN